MAEEDRVARAEQESRFGAPATGKRASMTTETVRCPACGAEVELQEAQRRGEELDEHAQLSCPTCGAGFDRRGNVQHEPAIGPYGAACGADHQERGLCPCSVCNDRSTRRDPNDAP